jgi:hypothetical protein
MGAHAYATGNDVAFADPSPSLFLVAHEAAHVVQQRAGVHLKGSVGQAGDSYEQNADAVAERVVRGESAVDLLGPAASGGSTAVQRKGHGHGPDVEHGEDERFGAGAKSDVHGRIIKVDAAGDNKTRITIGLGPKQGVLRGMEGYIVAPGGMLTDFQIEDSEGRVAHAIVHMPVQHVMGHDQVVVNPGSMPKAAEKHDVHTRVISNSIDGDRVKLLIAFGTNHGARAGMKGFLLSDSGARHMSFELAEEHPTHSVAYVHTTLDDVKAHSSVLLNPSK